jgi:hypothetical protein
MGAGKYDIKKDIVDRGKKIRLLAKYRSRRHYWAVQSLALKAPGYRSLEMRGRKEKRALKRMDALKSQKQNQEERDDKGEAVPLRSFRPIFEHETREGRG